MKKIIASAITVLFSCTQIVAQHETPGNKWKFNSVNQAGLLQGESQAAFNLQSVNGLRRGNFFGGVGTGLDYYKYRSIPLFAEGRKYFGNTASQFFIYGDAGTNFVWQEKSMSVYDAKQMYRPGFYGGAGIGYKAGLKNGMGITLSAGYTYKKIIEVQDEVNFCPFVGPCITSPETYRYNLNRILFQIGWLF